MVDQERQRQDAEAPPPEERIKDEKIVCNSLTTALSEAGLPTREGLAQAALHGADIPTSSEVATVPKNQIEIAQKIVNSYEFDRRRGISEFTMPTGVNDVDAMRVLNAFFRQFWDSYRRDDVPPVF